MTTDPRPAPDEARSAPLTVMVVSHVGGLWGAQRRLLDLAPLLADEGVQLTMASPAGELRDRWLGAGLPHEPLDLPVHAGVRSPDGRRAGPLALGREAGRVAWSVGAIVRRARRFDVVQSHSLWAHLETAAAGRLVHRPVVLDLHDIVSEGLGQRVLAAAARLATITLANSQATASTVKVPKAAICVVHPGVDLARFHPGPADPAIRAELTSDPAAPLIAILGRIDPNKGIDVLVSAVAGLGPPAASPHLVVIGREQVATPGYVAELRRRAETELGDRVRFLPPREDVPDVLRSVDVVVNASRHEPFGRTVLEAQASGVPVIGTAAGGIPEFVSDGDSGLLVRPLDAGDLERALDRLLRDPELRGRLVDRALDQARERFGLPAQARQTAAVYRSVAGG